jgi:hypothetical protein
MNVFLHTKATLRRVLLLLVGCLVGVLALIVMWVQTHG